jgi:threonine dehydratase
MDEYVTFRSVTEAAGVLHGVVHVTPVRTSQHLDTGVSGNVFLKCENFQRTGAFKFRGAYHAVWHVKSLGIVKSVATVSSGNHGQGIALAAGLLGLSAYVAMPEPVSSLKYQAIVRYGASVTLAANRLMAEEKIQEMLVQQDAAYVHAFNDPHVIAGQGTIMLEFLNQVGSLDALLAPVGGGGLLSGLCIAGHHLQPDLQIFACEPSGASDVEESIRLNRVVPMSQPRTLADGLRTSLGSRTLPILRDHLAGVLHVSEEEIVHAMRFAYEQLELVIEPSSAVALAPILRGEAALLGKRVGVVLTGGNIDLNELWSVPERHDRRSAGD